jgi:GrpB-like predicted nucleotidyltransferase (UPF0157 family)
MHWCEQVRKRHIMYLQNRRVNPNASHSSREERPTEMILHEHSPLWAEAFRELRDVYSRCLGDLAIAIEHVGSTAIPDIKAKPILDIDVVIADYDIFPRVVDRLALLGYSHNGDQGIRHREAFHGADEWTPHTDPRRHWHNHHLYVCPQWSEELKRHLLFRDYLRTNKTARREYEIIKLSIEARADGDRKKYATIKEEECRPFFRNMLAVALTTVAVPSTFPTDQPMR